jgi:hypothetical protein
MKRPLPPNWRDRLVKLEKKLQDLLMSVTKLEKAEDIVEETGQEPEKLNCYILF